MKKRIVLLCLGLLLAAACVGCRKKETLPEAVEPVAAVSESEPETTSEEENLPLTAESVIEGASEPVPLPSEDYYEPGAPKPEDAPEQNQNPSAPSEPTQPSEQPAASVSAEFKAQMDAYEAFFHEYADFMMEYSGQGAPESMEKAAELMQNDYRNTLDELDAVGSSKLSAGDAQYYSESMDRIRMIIASIPG